MNNNNYHVLDMTAGSHMFWWDKFNPLALFGDKRSKTHWVMFMKTEA